MQFTTTLATFLLTASGVIATPLANSDLQQRQVTPHAYLRFFNNGGCSEPWVEDAVIVQTPETVGAACNQFSIGSIQYHSFAVNTTDLTKTVRVYEKPGCDENNGPHQDLVLGCHSGTFTSYKFI